VCCSAPVPDDDAPTNPFQNQTFLDNLASGVAQNHITVGAAWTSEGAKGLTGVITYAASNIVDGSNSIPVRSEAAKRISISAKYWSVC